MAQLIKKKFIGNDQIDGSKLLLGNAEFVRAKKADGSVLNVFQVNASDKIEYSEAPLVTLEGTELNSLATIQQVNLKVQAEYDRAFAAEGLLQAAINASNSGLAWKPTAFLISEDPELQAAVEGALISDIMPFSDDEVPLIALADFAAGQYLIAKNGAASKIMKVYDDAGVLKVTFVGVDALVASHTFIVVNDLTDSPGPQENRSIWNFTGSDMIKLGDFDWSLASGIDLSVDFASLTGTIVAGDSVEVAIGKLMGNLAQAIIDLHQEVLTETGRATGVENGILGRLGTAETDILTKANRTLSNLNAPTAINQALLPDVPVTRRLGDLGSAWGAAFAARWGAPTATIDVGLVSGASGQNQVTMTSTAGISAIGIHNLFIPSLGLNLTITGVLNATTVTVAINLPSTLTSVQAYVIAGVTVRSENEVGSKPSGGAIVKSGNVVDGKSGSAVLQSGSSSNGSQTGDVVVSTGTTSNAANRGTLIFDAKEMQFNSKQLRNIANGTAPADAVSKGQMETYVGQSLTQAEINMYGVLSINTSNGVDALPDYIHTVTAFGSLNHTVKLPDQAVLMFGEKFEIMNQSTGIITVQRADGSNLLVSDPSLALTVPTGYRAVFVNNGAGVGFTMFLVPMANYNGTFRELNAASSRITNVQDGVALTDAVTVSQMSAVQSDVDSVAGRMDTAEADIIALDGRLDSLEGLDPMEYKGVYNASTNSPALANGVGGNGDVYRVTVAGSHDFGAGAISLAVGDKLVYNGSIWEKWDMTDAVDSVNGKQGAITLRANDINIADDSMTIQAKLDALAAASGGGYDALDGRLDVLEALAFEQEKFVVDAAMISAGYVDLARKAKPKSMVSFIERLGLHEGEDFTISEVGGVSRITFAGDILPAGNIALEDGQNLYFKYYY